MKGVLIATAVLLGLSSGCAVAQVNTNYNSNYDWATAKSLPATTEGTFGPMSRNTVLQNHLTGINRGKQCTAQTKRMLNRLAKDDYVGAQKAFSPTVRNVVTPDRLSQMWASLESSYGEPSKPTGEGVLIDSPAGGYSVIALELAYPQVKLTAHVMCDINNRVTDFKVTRDSQVATR